MKSRVLIVDDSWSMRQTLRLLLSPDFDCALAEDGASALQHARSEPPDIVVSDVSMMGMDGFELCRRMRAEPTLQQVPFIFLSGHEPPPGTLEAGHVYLLKPVRHAALLERMNALIPPRRGIEAPTGS
ncbi:MAG: response regulator [Cystobacter sp.]